MEVCKWSGDTGITIYGLPNSICAHSLTLFWLYYFHSYIPTMYVKYVRVGGGHTPLVASGRACDVHAHANTSPDLRGIVCDETRLPCKYGMCTIWCTHITYMYMYIHLWSWGTVCAHTKTQSIPYHTETNLYMAVLSSQTARTGVCIYCVHYCSTTLDPPTVHCTECMHQCVWSINSSIRHVYLHVVHTKCKPESCVNID